MNVNRRGFLIGATALLLAAPAIVRAGSLMPVKMPPLAANEILVPPFVNTVVRFDDGGFSTLIGDYGFQIGDHVSISGPGIQHRIGRVIKITDGGRSIQQA